MLVVLLTGCKSYFATEDRQLRYGGPAGYEMTRDAQLRVIEELARGGPTLAFDAYQPAGRDDDDDVDTCRGRRRRRRPRGPAAADATQPGSAPSRAACCCAPAPASP